MNFLNWLFGSLGGGKIAIRNDISEAFHIPEPTRSLLYVTSEPLSKMESPMQIKITISLDGVFQEANDDRYAEPSLIWTRLPIVANSNLETEKMYYPSYARLSPEQRYQYLRWLENVTRPTNLSYVFLYYYGLERQLILGDYDKAVDEIIKLVAHHDQGSFRHYASSALIASSALRKRPDIVTRAPFVLERPTNAGLLFLRELGHSPSAEHVISLAGAVGFKNRRYINSEPKLFTSNVEHEIRLYEHDNGKLLDKIDIASLEVQRDMYFANISMPHELRNIPTPQIIKDDSFKKILLGILTRAHQGTKDRLKEQAKSKK